MYCIVLWCFYANLKRIILNEKVPREILQNLWHSCFFVDGNSHFLLLVVTSIKQVLRRISVIFLTDSHVESTKREEDWLWPLSLSNADEELYGPNSNRSYFLTSNCLLAFYRVCTNLVFEQSYKLIQLKFYSSNQL